MPSAIQLSHCCDSHEHVVCNDEQTTHYHEASQDCHICHFQQHSFNYNLTSLIEIIEVEYKTVLKNQYLFLVNTSKKRTFLLRGPPYSLS